MLLNLQWNAIGDYTNRYKPVGKKSVGGRGRGEISRGRGQISRGEISSGESVGR